MSPRHAGLCKPARTVPTAETRSGLVIGRWIAGPTVLGSIADGLGAGNDLQGLRYGLIFSAGVLWLGAVVFMRQRALVY